MRGKNIWNNPAGFIEIIMLIDWFISVPNINGNYPITKPVTKITRT